MLPIKRKPGYRNETELTEEEINAIIEDYYNCKLKVKDLTEKYKLTKRALPNILKQRGIDSHKKNRYSLNENYFHEVDTEQKAYWLGYLFADGFVGNEHFHNIVFSQRESDGYIVKQFADDIGFTGHLRKSMPGKGTFENGQPQIVLNFSSKRMAADLYSLNMFPRKSMTMDKLPMLKHELYRHFVRGYFDGDGSATESVRNYYKGREYKSYKWSIIGTEAFNIKIAELLPVKTSLYDSHTPEMKYLGFSNNESMVKMFHYLYDGATRFLQRKKDVFIKALGYCHEKPWHENGINSQEVSANRAG